MTRRKLLLVGIDGLRVDDALTDGAAPALASIVRDGGILPMTMEVPTISGPGWSSILTGATHAQHGVFDNSFSGNTLHRSADFLSRIGRDLDRGTFAASGWPPLVDPAGPGPVIATRSDDQRAGRHRIVVRDGETYGYRYADGDITAFALLALREAGPDASFVYLGETDEAAHLYGGTSSEYAAATQRVDQHLARLASAVTRRSVDHDEEWVVAVTTDHGHVDEGGHGWDAPVLTRSFLATVVLRDGVAGPLPEAPEALRPETVADLLVDVVLTPGTTS
ncbi:MULTISPECIES: alkaline phosphatase family protein [unclassified Curtobacterium]|uniref:alkaline phosphatase family protein n=1 Tax=unclassified Curtobacterium TaxID=257496 RepID=UPI000D8385BA|nr:MULTISPECIES: alkaline phosphatase family protein [unclassified Curtobacterium]PYY55880.1 phosphodiesterase [Curtobacterium sp. MCSS17_011]WIE79212.1 alkaline phosphatase family protein [Curtobacterium sp. MCSS17_016]